MVQYATRGTRSRHREDILECDNPVHHVLQATSHLLQDSGDIGPDDFALLTIVVWVQNVAGFIASPLGGDVGEGGAGWNGGHGVKEAVIRGHPGRRIDMFS